MKITMIDPHELIPYEKNPRINHDAILEVAKSIDKYGFNQPVLIDQNNRICAGHTRVQASISLGMKKIPCFKKEMSESEFIQYNIADNKTGELSDWDDDLLKDLIMELDEDALDLPGFDQKELDKFFQEESEDEDSEDDEDASGTSKRTSKESSKMVFHCTLKQMLEINSKLDAIIKEQGLDNQVEALLFALKGFKGATKIKRVSRS